MAAAAAGVAATAIAGAAPADAAPKVRFRIPPKAYSESLIDLALQADVSLLGAAACPGTGPGLDGSFTLDAALRRLLADADCTWRIPATGVVQISQLTRRPVQTIAPTEVSEVLITATKRVQSATRLAASVSTLTRHQLTISGAIDPGDTSGQLSGVLTTDLGPARDKLLLRGLSDGAFTGRSRSTVGTYLDDTPLNYNAPDPDLRLVDVERVEVVRGPQGALYGGGSLSGLYRIVTRKPDLYDYAAEVRLTGALTYKGDPSHAAEGWANIPIAEGTAALRVSAYEETQGGYLNNTNPKKKDVDRTRRYGGRVALSFRPNDTWSLDLAAVGQHLVSDDTHYTLRGLKLTRLADVSEPHENDFGLVTATVRGAFDWGEIVSTSAYVQHKYSSVYNASRVINLFSQAASVGVYAENTRTEMAVQDVVLTSRGSSRIGWLAGAYASVTKEKSSGSMLGGFNFTLPLTEAYRDDRRDRIEELALYGEASYQLTPALMAAVGGRLFQTKVRTQSTVTAALRPGAERTLDRGDTYSGFSPKITLQRNFASGDLIYAVFSEGHRAGGFNTGGANPPSEARQIFSPDRLLNFELGGKKWLLSRRLSVNGSLFYDIWKNIQTDQFRSSGIPYTDNVGDARILGLETEATYVAPFGLTVQANILLSRTRFSQINPTPGAPSPKGLPNAPDVSFGLVAAYERRLTQDRTWRVTGTANYVGVSRVTFDPSLSPKMGDYVRAKVSTGVSGPGWDAEIFVTNPLNSRSNTFAFGNPFTFLQSSQTTPQRPMTIGLTLTASR